MGVITINNLTNMFNINTYNKQCEEEFDKFWENNNFSRFDIDRKVFLEQIIVSNTTLLRKFLESERERLTEKLYACKDYPMWNDYNKGQIDSLDDQITHINNLLETLK